ncbi:MAG: hypothetical protein AAFN79_03955 [Pseudomonadota bacterium]
MVDPFLAVVIGVLSGFGGALITGYFGPRELEKWRADQRATKWATPRKKLLKEKLTGAKGAGWVSIKQLSRLCGASEEDTRTLLIEIGARGGSIKGDREGWILISRYGLDKPGVQADDDEDN